MYSYILVDTSVLTSFYFAHSSRIWPDGLRIYVSFNCQPLYHTNVTYSNKHKFKHWFLFAKYEDTIRILLPTQIRLIYQSIVPKPISVTCHVFLIRVIDISLFKQKKAFEHRCFEPEKSYRCIDLKWDTGTKGNFTR